MTYADGTTASKDVTVEVPTDRLHDGRRQRDPDARRSRSATPAGFGTFAAGVANTYTASTTANVISTAGNALLVVTDTSSTAPGHLVNGNGTSVLAQALKARATNAANPNTAFADRLGHAADAPELPGGDQQRRGRAAVPAADRRQRRPALGRVLEDPDVHAVDDSAVRKPRSAAAVMAAAGRVL